MADISKINLGGVEYDIRDQKLKEDVEKKADKTYVDEEAERVVGYAEEVADNAEKAAKKYADDNKVAKVEGKQLSTEDFTTTLKQKLDGLNNYDDAYVRSAIEELQNSLDAIVNGDATSAIDSIQEILAFLSTITDTQTLAGIVADLKQYVDDEVESVSPLYVNIGMDFPNETTTGTLPDLEISFSDILSAAEGKRDIWIVVSDGTAYQCLVTYLSENSGGIAIRAYKHEVNGANFSTIAIAFVDGSVPVWHSNHIEFQEKLVSGENLATVNGKSLLEGGNIEIEGGGITEEKEVYIGSSEPPVGAKVWIDPTGTPSQPSQPSAGVEVIDNLESDSTTAALSARQGGILKGMIGATERGITIFRMPMGLESSSVENLYTLTSEEVGALQAALADPLALYMENNGNTMVMLGHYYNGNYHTFSGNTYAVGETGIAIRYTEAFIIMQVSDTEWSGCRFTRKEFFDN